MAGRATLYQLIDRNRWTTGLFIVLFSLLLGLVGWALGHFFNWGLGTYALFGLFIVLYNLVLYYNSDRLALA
ncbi:zinc metalloprotease HtpX, partial [candidate division WOR-3 bacterium]|nr:zinc metalloprotease HtpX [candidate division WOR-3 bacterium]